MGTAITNILVTKKTSIDKLKEKIFTVDSFNLLYQFLTTIRQNNGTPLINKEGDITSHLNGLFYRTANLMNAGLKLAFVFDGTAPDLKEAERKRRKEKKIVAQKEYEKAMEEKDIERMKKYAQRTSILTPKMVEQAKELIRYLGLPVIEAPSEGEAQAAYMAKKGDVWAVISQDTDSLIFGAPRVVKNLTISRRRKMNGKLSYEIVEPEIITLSDNLNNLGIDRDQLIALSMLVGTDYNIGGIKGIGPKKALNFVKKYKGDFDNMFIEAKWDEFFKYPWQDVFYLIKKIKVIDEYKLDFTDINYEKLIEFLVDKNGFSEERVKNTIKKLKKSSQNNSQKGLGEFFK